MRCPPLSKLPPPNTNKTGWPWTEDHPQLPDLMSDGQPWPRITIVTPSYNQGSYLEETLRSILLQGYPDLEYIVIDGGSTDESINVIRKYESWLTYWVSESDEGQSDAINKGFSLASGDLFNWINSDDLLMPGALQKIAKAYQTTPNNLIIGDVLNFDGDLGEAYLVHQQNISFGSLLRMWNKKTVWHQPGIFYPGPLWHNKGGLDKTLHYAMDYDLYCRFLAICSVTYVQSVVAKFRLHNTAKGISDPTTTLLEKRAIARRYLDQIPMARPLYELSLFLYFCKRGAGLLKQGNYKSSFNLLWATLAQKNVPK